MPAGQTMLGMKALSEASYILVPVYWEKGTRENKSDLSVTTVCLNINVSFC